MRLSNEEVRIINSKDFSCLVKVNKLSKIVNVPCKLEVNIKIRTEIIQGDIPWLIGREPMVNMGLIIDIEKWKYF